MCQEIVAPSQERELKQTIFVICVMNLEVAPSQERELKQTYQTWYVKKYGRSFTGA